MDIIKAARIRFLVQSLDERRLKSLEEICELRHLLVGEDAEDLRKKLDTDLGGLPPGFNPSLN